MKSLSDKNLDCKLTLETLEKIIREAITEIARRERKIIHHIDR